MKSGFLFLLLLSATTSLATSFIERPFPETVEDAPNIVRGKTGTSNAEWSEDQAGRKIYTYTELHVTESLKGSIEAPAHILIRELGGVRDGVGMEVAGTSRYEPGEDVVMMLGQRNPDKSYNVRGLMMGKLRVVKTDSGKEMLDGPAINHTDADGHSGANGGGQPDSDWTLEKLRKLIENQTPSLKAPQAEGISASAPPQPSVSATPGMKSDQAPQLQSSPSGDSDLGGLAKAAASALVFVGIWLVLRRLRKSRR